MSPLCRDTQNLSVDQGALERVLLAVKILRSSHDPTAESAVTQEEVDELKSLLWDDAAGLSLDQIARAVIQRETKRQEEDRS